MILWELIEDQLFQLCKYECIQGQNCIKSLLSSLAVLSTLSIVSTIVPIFGYYCELTCLY